MRFARLGPLGEEIPVVVTDHGTYDLRPITNDIDGEFLNSGTAGVSQALAAESLPAIDAQGLRIGAPIARPMAIVCIGMNYVAHAAESGAEPPASPVVFLKHPGAMVGPNDSIEIPHGSSRTDWEIELGVVIGKRAHYLDSPADALDHIGGLTVVNDITERYFQNEISGGQWSKGKCSPGFCPTGPYVVTPDEVDINNLDLHTWVNGEQRQNSNTSGMIFDVATIIHHLSQFMALEPGDLVITGTPEGVAASGRFDFLKAGDVAELEIPGIGRQRHEFVPGKASESSVPRVA